MNKELLFANVELNEEVLQKAIAYLVIENTNLKTKLEEIKNYIKEHYYEKLYDEFVISANDILKIIDKEIK